jgi:hypothetical protein
VLPSPNFNTEGILSIRTGAWSERIFCIGTGAGSLLVKVAEGCLCIGTGARSEAILCIGTGAWSDFNPLLVGAASGIVEAWLLPPSSSS